MISIHTNFTSVAIKTTMKINIHLVMAGIFHKCVLQTKGKQYHMATLQPHYDINMNCRQQKIICRSECAAVFE